MTRAPLILSAGIGDPRLTDHVWAQEMIALTDRARIALLLLGDGQAAPFDALAIAAWLVPYAGAVGLVPTIDTSGDTAGDTAGVHPDDVARGLAALDRATNGCSGWQPSTLMQPAVADSVPLGIDFVAATRSHWDEWCAAGERAPGDPPLPLPPLPPLQGHPILVQTDADPLWSHVAADIVVIDMDSPKPPPGQKCLLRTYTALAGLDQIEALYHEGIIDGIHLTPPYPRRGLQEFTDTMLPALVERGLLPEARRTGTLRQRLGLATMPHAVQPIPAE